MASYYMDLAGGGGGSGTTGDPWNLTDYRGVMGGLNVGDVIYVKGELTEGAFASLIPGPAWLVWDKWDTSHPNGSDDAWRLFFNYSGGLNMSKTILKRGVIYKAGGLNIGAPTGGTGHQIQNMIIQVTVSDLTIEYDSQLRGCSFNLTNNLIAGSPGIQIVDSVIEAASVSTGRTGDIASTNCAYTTASAGSSSTLCQFNWPGGPAWPAFNAAVESFAFAILAPGISTPPSPGNGAPAYTGYDTDPWGNSRSDIGGFSFPPSTYNVNYYAAANGSLTGDTTQVVTAGGDASAVTAVPDTNYSFTEWTGDHTSTDNPLTITNVNSNIDTTANFTIDTYAVTFHAGANGSLTGDATQTVNHGASSTAVTAVPDAGAAFVNWTGSLTSTDNPLTIPNVTSITDVTANFSVNTYSVNFSIDNQQRNRGDLVGDTAQTVAHGGSATAVRADARDKYDFSAWSGDNTSTTNPLTVSNVTGNMTIQANFVREFSSGRIFTGRRGGPNITFDDADGTDFRPGRFLGRRGFIPQNWGFRG